MAEPPQVLTLHDHHTFMSSDEDEDANADAASNEDPPGSYVHEEDYPTPQKSKFLRDADIDVPMTPGSMLLLEKGDEMAVIRRQVSKLTRQVARLQEENSRRRNREFILFPVVIGYCLIHLVRMILRSK